MEKERNIITDKLHHIEGFNPLDFLKQSIDPLTNEVYEYLPVNVKKIWFRMIYPKGRIITSVNLNNTGTIFCAKTRIYTSTDEVEPISETQSYCVINNMADKVKGMLNDEILEHYKLCAIGISESKALSNAGFGMQIENSHELSTEMADDPVLRRAESSEDGINEGSVKPERFNGCVPYVMDSAKQLSMPQSISEEKKNFPAVDMGIGIEEARKTVVHGIERYEGKTLGSLFDDEKYMGVIPYIASRKNLDEKIVSAALVLCNAMKK